MRPDREIERDLEKLGEKVQYPPTPDLARSVRQRLEEQPARGRAWIPTLPPRWAAAAAVLLFVLAVPVFSSAARDALSGIFSPGESGGASGGMESAAPRDGEVSPGRAEVQEETNAQMYVEDTDGAMASSAGSGEAEYGGPLPSSAGGAVSIGADLGLGERISLRQARERAGAPILLPDLGKPDEVYALPPPHEGGVALIYRARPGLPALGGTEAGLVLIELPGDIQSVFLEEAGSETGLEEVSVGGRRGYWASDGLPASVGATGLPGAGALIWPENDRALKLEANLPKQEAIRIADSVR